MLKKKTYEMAGGEGLMDFYAGETAQCNPKKGQGNRPGNSPLLWAQIVY